jgi:hypothetical protein
MTLAERLPTGRILAVAILVGLILVIWLGILNPSLSLWGRQADQADRTAEMIARLRHSAAEGPALQQELAKLGQSQHDRNAILMAPNANVAGATLQSEVKRIAEGDGATLRTIQQLPPVPEGTLNRIGVRVDLEADTAKLAHMLAHLESHTPIFLVRSVSVHGQEQQGNTSSARPLNLSIQLEITGLTGTPE